jgi:hypothetical protein
MRVVGLVTLLVTLPHVGAVVLNSPFSISIGQYRIRCGGPAETLEPGELLEESWSLLDDSVDEEIGTPCGRMYRHRPSNPGFSHALSEDLLSIPFGSAFRAKGGTKGAVVCAMERPFNAPLIKLTNSLLAHRLDQLGMGLVFMTGEDEMFDGGFVPKAEGDTVEAGEVLLPLPKEFAEEHYVRPLSDAS